MYGWRCFKWHAVLHLLTLFKTQGQYMLWKIKIAYIYIFITCKALYFAFVDLAKAFNCVTRKVLWWGLRSLGVEEWAVRAIQDMYFNAQIRVRSMVSAVKNLAWEWMCITALSLAHCSSSWCRKRFHANFLSVCHENSTLMTWRSLPTS